MTDFRISIPDEFMPGVDGARNKYNSDNTETEDFEPVNNAAYIQFVICSAARSWTDQYKTLLVETSNPVLVGHEFVDAEGNLSVFVEPASVPEAEAEAEAETTPV